MRAYPVFHGYGVELEWEESRMNQTQALLLTASPDCKRQLHAGDTVSFFLKPQHASGPGVPSFSHVITLPARSMTILATRMILPRAAASPTRSSAPPLSHSSTPNGAAIAGGIAASIAIVIM